VLVWLAIEREAVSVQTLQGNLVYPASTGAVLDAVRSLQRRSLLEAAREVLGRLPVWETRAIEEALRRLAEERGVRAGDLFTPLRVAVTGSTASPPLFETLAVLGPERAFGRLAVATERLHAA
ncbi:MAG TPA: hypothetical protein VKF37_18045, partial [Chloroflexota bacterium]|nr:hypothetical protein [Chloroflexota bacterium]